MVHHAHHRHRRIERGDDRLPKRLEASGQAGLRQRRRVRRDDLSIDDDLGHVGHLLLQHGDRLRRHREVHSRQARSDNNRWRMRRRRASRRRRDWPSRRRGHRHCPRRRRDHARLQVPDRPHAHCGEYAVGVDRGRARRGLVCGGEGDRREAVHRIELGRGLRRRHARLIETGVEPRENRRRRGYSPHLAGRVEHVDRVDRHGDLQRMRAGRRDARTAGPTDARHAAAPAGCRARA